MNLAENVFSSTGELPEWAKPWIGNWESLGGKWPDDCDPVVIKNTDGRVEIFMVGLTKSFTTDGKKVLAEDGIRQFIINACYLSSTGLLPILIRNNV